jgi:hypothetical protein
LLNAACIAVPIAASVGIAEPIGTYQTVLPFSDETPPEIGWIAA